MVLRAIRTSDTNDHIRKILIRMTISTIDNLDRVIKFLKLKGWTNQAPLYPNVPSDTPEVLDTSEAFHLWDLLTFRYDNIEQTHIYSILAHDGEFKFFLKEGLDYILKKQATILEKECYYFGLPLPKRPSVTMKKSADTEIVDDDYLYRVILAGTQGAAIMHAQAFKQSITNDRVRKIFKKLLIDEINYIDKLIKFGKLKEWLFVSPQYKL